MQHLATAAARRQRQVHPIAVEKRADAIAMARQDAGEHRDELAGDRFLLEVLRAEIDGCGEIEEEPRGDFALFHVLAHVRA
jgi:hypothetical protein